MVISSCKHNYKLVLLCKGEFCASISIEEIKKFPGFERSFFISVTQNLSFLSFVFKLDVFVLLLFFLRLQTLYAENKIPRKT